MRVVTIIINERCPLRCRHCSLGFSETYHGNSYRISSETLTHMIENVDPQLYEMVLFAGGEPSLDPTLVKTGIEVCQRMGLVSAMVSAPIWASTAISAKRMLDKLQGLVHLILSYDYYHLDFLKFSHYETAAREASSRGIQVDLHLTYTSAAEKQSLIDSVAPIRDIVFIHPQRTVSIGNAANPDNVHMDYVVINDAKDLEALPRACMPGNVLIDSKLGVHGCCWSAGGEVSPFSFAANGHPLHDTFQNMENSPVFQAVLNKGFLDSLTEQGKQLLAARFKGQRFANECDICVASMKQGADVIWRECV
jgi:organic radical activating enzyme